MYKFMEYAREKICNDYANKRQWTKDKNEKIKLANRENEIWQNDRALLEKVIDYENLFKKARIELQEKLKQGEQEK